MCVPVFGGGVRFVCSRRVAVAMLVASTHPQFTTRVFDGRFPQAHGLGSTHAAGLHDGVLAAALIAMRSAPVPAEAAPPPVADEKCRRAGSRACWNKSGS
jgi:hypothetical protein